MVDAYHIPPQLFAFVSLACVHGILLLSFNIVHIHSQIYLYKHKSKYHMMAISCMYRHVTQTCLVKDHNFLENHNHSPLFP